MLKTQGTEMFKSIVSSRLTHLLLSLITKSAFNADRQRDRQTEWGLLESSGVDWGGGDVPSYSLLLAVPDCAGRERRRTSSEDCGVPHSHTAPPQKRPQSVPAHAEVTKCPWLVFSSLERNAQHNSPTHPHPSIILILHTWAEQTVLGETEC